LGRHIIAVVSGFAVWSVLWIAAGRTVVFLLPDHFNPETHATRAAPVLVLLVPSNMAGVALRRLSDR